MNECCDGWDYSDLAVGQCPQCGDNVDKNGDAVVGCNYSPTQCDLCGSKPCNQSC